MLIENLQTNDLIESRLKEFETLNQHGNPEWFSELCFCILTSNSKAQTALNIQAELGTIGFLELNQELLSETIKKNKHRFHNTKAKYIVQARKFYDIKDRLIGLSSLEARDFIVNNVKGLGYKEASHFLRNVGYQDLAIIDRHILKYMKSSNMINEIPKTVSKKFYLDCESKLKSISERLDRLDLIIWQKVTGKVLK